ncbi:hypothetical protein S83_019466, partial [Arachis hypogaea]
LALGAVNSEVLLGSNVLFFRPVINTLKRDQTNHHDLTSPIHRCEGAENKNQLLIVLNMNKPMMPPYAALYSPGRVYTHPAIPIGSYPHGQGVPSSPAISYDIRILAAQALTTMAIRSGEPFSNGADKGDSGTSLGVLLSPMIKVLDEMYRVQDDLIKKICNHDNAKKEWTDDELKKLYETHERLLDLVS